MKRLFAIFVLLSAAAHATVRTAATCAASDFNTQITAAVEGDTVQGPTAGGTVTWTTAITFSKNIILDGKNSSTGNACTITLNNPGSLAITVTSTASTHLEIRNFTFNGAGQTTNGYKIKINQTPSTQTWLVHDNVFNGADAAIQANGRGTGIIYHNSFTDSAALAEEITIQGASAGDYSTLQDDMVPGSGTNKIFIEGNTFTGTTTSNYAFFQTYYGGAFVARWNDFVNFGIETHGSAPGNCTGEQGARWYEVYNNNMTHTNGNSVPLKFRGGSGVVFNNSTTIAANVTATEDCSTQPWPIQGMISLGIQPLASGTNTTYPDATKWNPLYIWNNTSLPTNNGGNALVQLGASEFACTHTGNKCDAVTTSNRTFPTSLLRCESSADVTAGCPVTYSYSPFTCPHPSTGLSGTCALGTIGRAGYAVAANTTWIVNNSQAPGGTGPVCSDSGAGTLASPFCTLDHALTVMISGDTVQIRSGNYTLAGGFLLVQGPSGTAGQHTTIMGFPGDAAPHFTGTTGGSGFRLQNVQFVDVTGLEISTCEECTQTEGGSNITWSNMNIHDAQGACNYVHKCTSAFCSGAVPSHVTWQNSTINNCGLLTSTNGDGFYIGTSGDNTDTTNFTTIQGNTITNTQTECVNVKDFTNNTTIDRNTCDHNSLGNNGFVDSAIMLKSSTPTNTANDFVTNNVISNTGPGSNCGATPSCTAVNSALRLQHQATVFNNIIYGPNLASLGFCFYTDNSDTRLVYQNTCDAAGAASARFINVATGASPTITNNIGSATTNNAALNTTWFTNYAGHDYHLTASHASAVNVNSVAPTDKDGVTRTATPDFGAYMFTGVVTFSISGTISGAGGPGASVALSGTSTGTTTADGSGNYAFSGLTNGSYTVTPSQSGYTFNPASLNVTISGTSQPSQNFATKDFTVSVSPGSLSVTQGTTSPATTVTVTSLNSFNANVALTITNALPSGVTALFSPTSCTPPANSVCTSSLTFTATGSAATGTTTQVVQGVSGVPRTTNLTLTVVPLAAAPTFSPVAGTYTGPQNITMSSTTPSATICYTTDGTTPGVTPPTCAPGTLYTSPVPISANTSFKARAGATGFTTSAVTNASYVINFATADATPTSLTFSQRNQGTTSPSQGVTITNNGTGPVTITSITLAGDYAQTNNCPISPATLAAAANCLINVTYTPTKGGVRRGSLTVASNAFVNPTIVPIIGTSPGWSLNPVSGNFKVGGAGTGVAVVLPQVWVNNIEYIGKTTNTITMPSTGTGGSWTCPGVGTFGPYSVAGVPDTQAGLQQAVNDAETCRLNGTNHPGTKIILPIGHVYTGTNGITLPQTAGDLTSFTNFIVITSSSPLPTGQTVCSHGIQDNLAQSTQPGIRNVGCNGSAMSYQLGVTTFNTNGVAWGAPVTGAFTLANGTVTSTANYNDIAHMATIESNNQAINTGPADVNGIGPHHFAVTNIEARPVAGAGLASAPLAAGQGSETAESQLPHNIHFEYDYIHADWNDAPVNGSGVATGPATGFNSISNDVVFHCIYCSLAYSYIDRSLRPGSEGHGISVLLGKQIKTVHNWVEGQSIGFLTGGFASNIPIPNFDVGSDMEDRANRYTYPYSWILAQDKGYNPDSFYTTTGGTGTGAIIHVLTTNGAPNAQAIFGIEVINGGTGYSLNDVLTVTNVYDNGTGGTITVTGVGGGGAINAAVVSSGTGYTNASGLATTPNTGGGTGATVNITTTGGKITGVTLGSGGSGYTAANNLTVVQGGGAGGLVGVGNIGAGGTITSIAVASGNAYTINGYVNKNNDEHKFSNRIVLDGLIAENKDFSGGQGQVISMKANQTSAVGGGSNYWTTQVNSTLTNTIMRINCSGTSMGFRSDTGNGGGGGISDRVGAYNYTNNLMYDIDIANPGCQGSIAFGSRIASSSGGVTWTATVTRTANVATATLQSTSVADGQGRFHIGDPVIAFNCGDSSFNVPAAFPALTMGPGAVAGTITAGLVVAYPNPGPNVSSPVTCQINNMQGTPDHFTANHNSDFISSGVNQAQDPSSPLLGTGTHSCVLAPFATWTNVISTNGGPNAPPIGEGTRSIQCMLDVNTLQYHHNALPLRDTFVTCPGHAAGAGGINACYSAFDVNHAPVVPASNTLWGTDAPNCGVGITDPTTGNCLGIIGNMNTASFNYILPDWHNYRLCHVGDAACSNKASTYAAGGTHQASDGTDMGADFTKFDPAQTSNQYVCPYTCGSPGPYPDH